jgi:hypothetical protein
MLALDDVSETVSSGKVSKTGTAAKAAAIKRTPDRPRVCLISPPDP